MNNQEEQEKLKIRRKIESLNSLPTLPGVVQKIQTMVSNPRTSAADIGKVISADQVLSAKVLKLINSAFYGYPGRISSVTHGIVLLGFNVVKSLVLTTSVFDIMAKGMIGLWNHSLGTAIVAGIIAEEKISENPEEVSVAALLHDIGKVVINLESNEEYQKIIALVQKKDISFYEAENEILSFNHCDVAGWLCQKWNLPPNLSEPITCHHRPSSARITPKQTAIVHVADILIKAKGYGFGGDDIVPMIDKKAWEILQLSFTELEKIVEEMEIRLEAVEDFSLISGLKESE